MNLLRNSVIAFATLATSSLALLGAQAATTGSGDYHGGRITTPTGTAVCVNLNQANQVALDCNWAQQDASHRGGPLNTATTGGDFKAVLVKVGPHSSMHCLTYTSRSTQGVSYGGGLSCDQRGPVSSEGVRAIKVGQDDFSKGTIAVPGGKVGCLYVHKARMRTMNCDWAHETYGEFGANSTNRTAGTHGVKAWQVTTPWGTLPCVVRDSDGGLDEHGRGLSCNWGLLDEARRGGKLIHHQDGDVNSNYFRHDQDRWVVRTVSGFYENQTPTCVYWFGKQGDNTSKRRHAGESGVSCFGFQG